MNLPDRSKWPEGATHWSPADAAMRLEAYWRPNGYGAFDCWALTSEPRFWQKNYATLPDYAVELLADWNGEGLPPAGTACEYKRPHGWRKVKVFAVKPNYNDSDSALFTFEDGMWGACDQPSMFRPARTAEQVANEELAYLIAGYYGFDDPRVADTKLAAYLIDHDYRKQVAP